MPLAAVLVTCFTTALLPSNYTHSRPKWSHRWHALLRSIPQQLRESAQLPFFLQVYQGRIPATFSRMPSASPTHASPAARFLKRLLASVVALVFVLYSIDFCWYHLRLAAPKLGLANSSVHRVRLLAIQDKGNKVEFQIDALHPEEDVPCSRSLFPQAQQNPCWYVSRHANDPIAM